MRAPTAPAEPARADLIADTQVPRFMRTMEPAAEAG